MNSGLILYAMLAALFALFWRQVRGKSFEDLLNEDSSLHHQVHRVIHKHPRGSTWQEFQTWMREEI